MHGNISALQIHTPQERLPPTKMKLYKINLMVKKVTRIKVITEQMTNKFKQLNSTMYEIEKY